MPTRPAADAALTRGINAAIAAYVLWGLLTIYWKQLAALDALELIGWRVLMAAAVMIVVVTIRGRWPVVRGALRSRRLLGRLILSGALLTFNWTMYVTAVVSDQIIETALGYFLAPLGTMAIGITIFGERLSRSKWFAVGCATTAVVILTVSAGRIPWIAIAIAASWSLYGLAKRTVALSPIESLTGETLVMLAPAICIVAWGATRSNGIPQSASSIEWFFLVGTGLATAVPLLLFSLAARSVPFTILGPLNYLVPLINFGLGWALYREPVPLARFMGFALVWCALVAVTVEGFGSAARSSRSRPTDRTSEEHEHRAGVCQTESPPP